MKSDGIQIFLLSWWQVRDLFETRQSEMGENPLINHN